MSPGRMLEKQVRKVACDRHRRNLTLDDDAIRCVAQVRVWLIQQRTSAEAMRRSAEQAHVTTHGGDVEAAALCGGACCW